MQWQPIETAPKDNSAVLVYVPMRSVKFMATAFWDTVAGEWRVAWTGLHNKPSVIKDPEPTHWMPLPEPPITNGDGETG
jgi:hypothetical protein